MSAVEQLTTPLEKTKPKARNQIQRLNIAALQAELQKLAGNLKVEVKQKNNQNPRVSIYETDKAIYVSINTKKIHTLKQLEDVLDFCRAGVVL